MTEAIDRLANELADRYRIERELGAGGMATVYLARDLKHDRQVALKVLRPELAAVIGADRFLNEIKVTANLQHPHILPLYDSGSAGGLLFYVMPLVEGDSLRDRLDRERQLPVDDAVAITRAVAGALDYAHRSGVIHRDIKPENVLLHDGQPLVADFGIALALSAAGGSRLTETGLSLGTPHYMSPEQATGERELDQRSDLYSLGCVAYEMLAGEPPHTGPTAQSVIAKIVTESPKSLSAVRRSVPEHVEAAIHRALEKLPADRFVTAGAFAEALASPGALTAASGSFVTARRRSRPWPIAAAAALALVAGVLAGRATKGSDPTESTVLRFAIPIGPGHRLSSAPVQSIALKPDGSALAYNANVEGSDAIFLRRFDALESVEIAGTRAFAVTNPFFSPDGNWIGYQDFLTRDISKVPLAGGVPTRLGGSSVNGGFAWTKQGEVLFYGPTRGIMALPESGGEATPVSMPDTAHGETGRFLPDPLPGSDAMLVTFNAVGLATARLGGTGIAVVWPKTGERKVVITSGAGGARYSPTGHIVYAREDGALMADRFDLDRMEVAGTPVMIASSIHITGGTGLPAFALSQEGTLAYVAAMPAQVVLVDRAGNTTPVTTEPQAYHSPRFSPDGGRIAMDITQSTGRDVWAYDMEQGTLTRVTFERDTNDPVWAPDGRRICYGSAKTGLRSTYCANADGSGEPESLLIGDKENTVGAWLPDGQGVLLIPFSADHSYDLVLMDPDSDGPPEPILTTPFTEEFPALSPDGEWLAYVSDESGRSELYVRPLHRREGRVQVSQAGAAEVVWSRDGREIFYVEQSPSGARLIAARVETSPMFRVLLREPLFDTSPYEAASPHANYDVHPDGQRFVMVQRAAASEVVVVKNFHLEVDRANKQ